MRKEIKIWDKKLEISGDTIGYMLSDADELSFQKYNTSENGRWLYFYNGGVYIGSIWVKTDTDIKTVEKFLEETE